MRMSIRMKYAAVAAGATLVAIAAATPFVDLPVRSDGKGADILSTMPRRSPEERLAGALVNKKATVSVKLSTATPASAKAPNVPRVVPATAVVPTAAAPVAVPALVPAVAAAPLAAVPAVIPAAAAGGTSLLLPPLIIPGGGGNNIRPPTVLPPGGGSANPPPPVPGVPEPGTWMMMILGFGLLGTFLRRRRRTLDEQRTTDTVLAEAGALH